MHYHIFKNAGSSFQSALNQAFGKYLHTYDAPWADGVLSPGEVASYAARHIQAKAIITHQAILPAPKIRGCTVLRSILVRDPLARIRSIYAFERRQARSTAGAQKAKELDFKGYVEWRLSCSAGMFCNYQVYYCSRTKDTQPDEIMTESHLERAIKNLDGIDIVGTVERYEQWLALAHAILSRFFPDLSLTVARCNVTGSGDSNGHTQILGHLIDELGSNLAERLLECNHLDMGLHQVADAVLTRRLAEQRVDISLLTAYASTFQACLASAPDKKS